MSYATVPVFGAEHKRLYKETQLKYIVSDCENSTNHLVYAVEKDLGLTIMHTSADEPSSFPIKKPPYSKIKHKT